MKGSIPLLNKAMQKVDYAWFEENKWQTHGAHPPHHAHGGGPRGPM